MGACRERLAGPASMRERSLHAARCWAKAGSRTTCLPADAEACGPSSRGGPASKQGIAAVDQKRVAGVVARGLAHQVDGDAAEIVTGAPASHGNPRQHVARELF